MNQVNIKIKNYFIFELISTNYINILKERIFSSSNLTYI